MVMLFASWRWIFGVLAMASTGVAVWVILKLPETLKPENRRAINLAEIGAAFRITLQSRLGMGYTLAMTVLYGALFGFINSAPQVFEEAFNAPHLFTVTFAVVAGFIAIASLLNARLVNRLGMRMISHAALLAFIGLSGIHAALALSGHETILTFAVLQAGAMFSFGLMSGNFGAMAMEPLGHVAGAAASVQGFISMVGGSLIGFFIGQQFNGTLAPITLGYLVCGLAALAIVLAAERGRLFVTRSGPPAEPAVGAH